MNGSPPRISVIVAAYNAEAYLREAIESVLSQTASDWELIIVDDGSTDDTARVAATATDPRITLIRQENLGVSAARNRGFAASRGDYVLFLDADDALYPEALQRLGKGLDGHPDAVLSFGSCVRFHFSLPLSEAAREPLRWRPKPSGQALATVLVGSTPLIGAALVRRDSLAQIDGFSAELDMGEDWVLWCDLAALGPIRYIGGSPVMGYRLRAGSSTRRLGLDPKAHWPAIDRIYARPALRLRFSPNEIARLRKRSEAFALGMASRELLRNCDWRRARSILLDALKRDPTSLGDWFFLPFALVGWLPKTARRFLE